jgi:hypothetical protein
MGYKFDEVCNGTQKTAAKDITQTETGSPGHHIIRDRVNYQKRHKLA